jgi:RsiW-degrading membrane proteinase PrsW (M82 family)
MDLLISTAIVFLATALWLVLLYRLDPNWRDKRSGHVIALMVLAGGVSTIPAWFAYDINPFWFTYRYGAFPFHFAVAGMTEELVKFVTFILMARVLKSIREPHDGIIQGAAIGVGFSAVEDILYGFWMGPQVALTRTLLVGFHALAGAFWGFAWAGAVYENIEERQPRAYRLALLGFIPVAVLHSLYNTLIYIAADRATTLFLLYGFEAILLFVAVKGYRWMLERSPYHRFPYSDAELAVSVIRKGLFVNP